MKHHRLLLPLVLFAICLAPGRKLSAQAPYEILHDTLSATAWFGGDDRDGSARSAGIGQGVRIDTAIVLTDFSFFFATRFDYFMNPDGFGHDITLVLNIRDSLGTILQTLATFVPASFESGWVTWTDINMNVDEGTLLIFTTYLVGAYDLNEYTSSNGADQFQLYTQGQRYGKDGVSDADMELWTDWSTHPSWDSMFWLEGTMQPVGVDEVKGSMPSEYALLQNYPNPFNPKTKLEFSLPRQTKTNLKIFDLLGNTIAILEDGTLPAGRHTRIWDAQAAATGVYVARLEAGGATMTRKLVLIR